MKKKTQKTKNQFCRMKIEVIARNAKGKVIKRVCNDNDLYMDNFAALTASIFKELISFTDAIAYPVKTITNESYVTIGGNIDDGGTRSSMGPFVSKVPTSFYLMVKVGNGSTTPSHDQYSLSGSQLGSNTTVSIPVLTVGQGASAQQALITFGATLTLTTGGTVTEAGLFTAVDVIKNAGVWLDDLMLCRDTFTGIAIPNGGSITINYTLVFNA